MFLRPARQAHDTAIDQQVTIGHTNIYVTGLDRPAIDCLGDRQRPTTIEDAGEQARGSRRHMHDGEQRRRKFRRQIAHQLLQRFDSAGGCSEYDDSRGTTQA